MNSTWKTESQGKLHCCRHTGSEAPGIRFYNRKELQAQSEESLLSFHGNTDEGWESFPMQTRLCFCMGWTNALGCFLLSVVQLPGASFPHWHQRAPPCAVGWAAEGWVCSSPGKHNRNWHLFCALASKEGDYSCSCFCSLLKKCLFLKYPLLNHMAVSI